MVVYRILLLAVAFALSQNIACENGDCRHNKKNPDTLQAVWRHGTSKDKQLDCFTRNDSNSFITTNWGLKINDSDSLKAGQRGPTLLEDFEFREKITHFDHERIPERVVHARGSAAHGYFQSYSDWSNLTRAKFLRDPSIKTPVFVRFSTVAGPRGSADTVRDAITYPFFFIQDAIKFPDLIHAVKAEPDRSFPTAASAHDTFYDFISLSPETIHMVLWVLSDRGIPRSYRMMQGFGVHTFRLITEENRAVFVKFHWNPKYGLASLAWDEAQKIAGKDPDFHRRDLWEAIEKGDYPEWELGVQIVKEDEEFEFDFDLLDPTKFIPEELIPVIPLGRMVLNRNPDNFFAETEQSTYHLGHVVPGIGFTNDPLLQGRLFSYLDTQINRHHSANFQNIPINRPAVSIHNNYRDGFMQTVINKGRVAYYPNSLQEGSPHLTPPNHGGYKTYAELTGGPVFRGKSPSFFNFYSQAQLFYNSLTDIEKQHLINALRFELGLVETVSIRKRMIVHFNHIDHEFASRIAQVIDVPVPRTIYPNFNKSSPSVSIEQHPRKTIRTRHVLIYIAEGVELSILNVLVRLLNSKGAYLIFVAPKQGRVRGTNYIATQTFATTDAVLNDAILVPGGQRAVELLLKNYPQYLNGQPIKFLREAYQHGKPIAVIGEGLELLRSAEITLGNGVTFLHSNGDSEAFAHDFAKNILHGRFWYREVLDKKLQQNYD
ncbi:unnamed protein product [Didymodactylos carnosus]|uniref:Catalase n=1 Tax=Didymodactylos carnosus TaxID=1234261 RepID=A0A815GMD4_9BILA|nr:unnamed protein product [Didymodactylos carnosus]CAF4200420.1 unnamed protein product [Didymodactylos carnosus]